MPPQRYVNGPDALPPDLLDQLVAFCKGRPTYIFVPARRNLDRAARDEEVLRLYHQGVRVPEIARRVFLSERMVWRLLARARAAGAPSDPGPSQQCENPQARR